MSLPQDLKFRVQHTELPPAVSRADLLTAIQENNRKSRLEGLPDHLNPDILDPDKTEAMLAGLSTLPPEALRPLAGKTLYLSYPALMTGSSAPTRTESFAHPLNLEVVDVQRDLVLARLTVPLDCPLARERATEARSRYQSSEKEVNALETRLSAAAGAVDKEREVLTALAFAKSRRFAVAHVWQQNAEAWVHCPGTDNAARADAEAAGQAVASSVVPSGAGMP